MSKERVWVAIVSDKEKARSRPKLKREIQKNPNIEVILLSRVKTSRIRQEIKKEKPDLVLVTASLNRSEEVQELRGFVTRLRKHLPQARIVIHAPRLSHSQRETFFEAGANACIDQRLPYEALGAGLEKIVSGEEIADLRIIRKRETR